MSKNDPSSDALLVSMQTAATMLGISRRYVYDLIEQKKFRRVKIGRRALIARAEILDFVAQQREMQKST